MQTSKPIKWLIGTICVVLISLLAIEALIKFDVIAQSRYKSSKSKTSKGISKTPNFMKNSIVEVSKFVTPSTVQIINMAEAQRGLGEKYLLPKGTGTGIIVNKEGYILTNSHVVNGCAALLVVLSNDQQLAAKLIGEDPKSDVAVIKIEKVPSDIKPAKLGNSDKLQVGEWVVAIGNPFGMRNTATTGIVSAVNQPKRAGVALEDLLYIQTDAPINPGNSGGPLVNIQGEVIGINSWIYTGGGSAGSVGLGFAIPINPAKDIMAELIKNGKMYHKFVGAEIWQINMLLAYSYNYNTLDSFLTDMNMKETTGGFVKSVRPDSPASKAGLKEGDVVIEFAGKKIKTPRDYTAALAKYKPDQEVELKIVRGGSEQTLKLTIGKQTDEE